MSDYSLTKSRVLQWLAIVVVLIAIAGGYFYYHSRAAQTTTDNRPSFEAPLRTDLNLASGIGSATYSRADGADRRATVTDWEGHIIPVKAGEARFTGARRVENLLSYSEAFQNAAWLKLGTGTIATATDNNTIAPDGTTTGVLLDTSGAADDRIAQSLTVTAGTYVFSVWLKQVGAGGTVRVESSGVGTGGALVTPTTTWQRFSITSTVATGGVLNVYPINRSSGGTATMVYAWHPELENVTGQSNQNPSEYVSTNVKTSFPYHGAGVDGVRYFDYQNSNTVASNVVTEAKGVAIPESTLRGYLAEGSRANLRTYSQDCSNAVWTLNNATWVSKSSGAATAPDGSVTGCKLADVDTSSNARLASATGATVSAGVITGSAYVKAGEYNSLVFYLTESAHAVRVVVSNLDTTASIDTAAVWWGTDLSSPSATIASAGNGWWRVTLTATSAAGSANAGVGIYNKGGSVYIGVPGSGIYFWGAQLEQASFASSYIPTTSASVTRAADSLQYVGSGNFNDTAGTVSIEATTEWTGGSGTDVFFTSDTSTGQRMAMWHWNGTANSLVADRNGGGGTRNNFDYSSAVITAGTAMKLAQRWTSTANSLFRDGSLRGSDTTLTLPYDAISGISVGRTTYVAEAYASLKNVRAWKKALTDTELSNLTSLIQAVSDSAFKKAVNRPPNDLGLVGYWSFEDGSGTKATDFSGNNNTGTLTNGPTWTDGRFGKAVSFDGTDDYVNIASMSGLSSSAITVSAWVKISAHKNWNNVVGHEWVASNGSWLLFSDSSGNAYFGIYDTSQHTAASSSFSAGVWHHLIGTYDGSVIRIYVDGVAGSSTALSGVTLDTVGQVGLSSSSGSVFSGQIDDVRIYNRALSSDEITNLYQKTSQAKLSVSHNDKLTNGLVGLWSFNGPDLSGTTAYDRSGQGNNGTLTNGPVVAEGKIGQGISFDGSNDYVNIPDNDAIDFDYSQDFSVAFWMRAPVAQIETTNTDNALEEKWAGSGGYPYTFRMYNQTYGTVGDRGKVRFARYDGTHNPYAISSVAVNDNIWHHVVGVKSGSTMTLYMDGASSGTSTDTTTATTTNATSVSLGARNGASNRFIGSLDEFRVYNRTLSAAEVLELYNQGR